MLTNYFRIIPLLIACTFGASAVFGAATSTNFMLDTDQIDSGGDIATSSNFRLEGTIGQFVTGSLTSPTFITAVGGGIGSAGGSPGENQVSPLVSTVNMSYVDNGTALGFSEGIMPNIGIRTVYVYGTVVDQNGAGTITGVTSRLYRSGVGNGCTADEFSCYDTVGSCSVATTTATAAHYSCRYDISSSIDSTDSIGSYPAEFWTARVQVADTSGYTNSSTNDIEVNSLAAFTLATTTIAFEVMALGATTTASTSKSLELIQAGNIPADITLSSFTNLTCSDAGYIPKENMKWSIFNVGYDHASSTSFTSSPTRAYLNVPRKTDATVPTGITYLNLGIPAQGLGGECSGSIMVNMVPAQ